jgi:hypothetical protein
LRNRRRNVTYGAFWNNARANCPQTGQNPGFCVEKRAVINRLSMELNKFLRRGFSCFAETPLTSTLHLGILAKSVWMPWCSLRA